MDGATEIAPGGPLAAYRARVASGQLEADPAQGFAAERLQSLWRRLRNYAPERPHDDRSVWSRLRGRKPADDIPENYPHGIYLVGEVGRGKSMLMDMFFDGAEVERKRRVHFHEFMQEVHRRIYAWRREPHRLADPHSDDPIPPLADQIAAGAWLLCFDEFQLNDVADAAILSRLFKALFARGVVVVATSNTVPDDLFAGQPGRDAFLPFIALLKQYLDLIVMTGNRDWRRQRLKSLPTWHVPADQNAGAALDAAFDELSGGVKPGPERLTVMGRQFVIPKAAGGVARFNFEALCGQPLGPGDYLALATHYQALIVDAVPILSSENYNHARRFIILIDALYEHRVKLIASAAAIPDRLYLEGDDTRVFQRTASRLEEMQSSAYLALSHLT